MEMGMHLRKKSPLQSLNRCKTRGRGRTACRVLMDNNSDPNTSWIKALLWLPLSGVQCSFVLPLLNARLNLFVTNHTDAWSIPLHLPVKVFLHFSSFEQPMPLVPPPSQEVANPSHQTRSETGFQKPHFKSFFANFEFFKEHVLKIFHLKSMTRNTLY